MTDLEKRAHDLAVILSQQNIKTEKIDCDSSAVFNFVKDYEHYYKYVLNSFEDIK